MKRNVFASVKLDFIYIKSAAQLSCNWTKSDYTDMSESSSILISVITLGHCTHSLGKKNTFPFRLFWVV